MNPVQIAAAMSLEFGAVMEGPDVAGDLTHLVLWLPNGRGLSLKHHEGYDAPGTVEILPVREKAPDRAVEYNGTPFRHDYSTPVTIDVKQGADIDTVRAALRILRELPKIDITDLRDTRELRRPAVHYGYDRSLCGTLRPDESLTQTVKDIRCLPCMVEVHRAV